MRARAVGRSRRVDDRERARRAQVEVLLDDGVDLRADVLKVPHHGAATSLEPFFEAVEAALPIPLEHLSAVRLLAEAARASDGVDRVVIAPDLGATKHDHQPKPDSFRVFLDPAGHPFCLCWD